MAPKLSAASIVADQIIPGLILWADLTGYEALEKQLKPIVQSKPLEAVYRRSTNQVRDSKARGIPPSAQQNLKNVLSHCFIFVTFSKAVCSLSLDPSTETELTESVSSSASKLFSSLRTLTDYPEVSESIITVDEIADASLRLVRELLQKALIEPKNSKLGLANKEALEGGGDSFENLTSFVSALDRCSGPKIAAKVAKGVLDGLPREVEAKNEIISSIKRTLRSFGGREVETPVFERTDVLLGKYGEDEKLVYELADQGGERLALRFDLTVPFARFVATNNVEKLRRIQIAKVYRRDQPQIAHGRLREFYQCDFDIVDKFASYPNVDQTTLPLAYSNFSFQSSPQTQNLLTSFYAADVVQQDAEALTCALSVMHVVIEPILLKSSKKTEMQLVVSHRTILTTLIEDCGVEKRQIPTVSSSLDKLDKLPWSVVDSELVKDKKVPREVVDRLSLFNSFAVMSMKDFMSIVSTAVSRLIDYRSTEESATNQLDGLFTRLMSSHAPFRDACLSLCVSGSLVKTYDSKLSDALNIDLRLCRGLDYYTGLIFETRLLDSSTLDNLGSIMGGGRYDQLLCMYSQRSIEKFPAVGFSVGIERLFRIALASSSIIETPARAVSNSCNVLICHLAGAVDLSDLVSQTEMPPIIQDLVDPVARTVDVLAVSRRLCHLVRSQCNLSCLVSPKIGEKLVKQLQNATNLDAKIVIIVAEDELKDGKVQVKRSQQSEVVKIDDLVEYLACCC